MRLGHMIRALPAGNGGFPRWAFIMPRLGTYRSFLICNVLVPRLQFCLWIEW